MDKNYFENKLVEENQNLVYKVIWSNFRGNLSNTRLDKDFLIEEMVSVGNIGLVKASKTWDETKGVKFSTYATTSIYKSLVTYFVDKYNKQVDDGDSVSMQTTIGNNEEEEGTIEDLIGDERYSNETPLVMSIIEASKESQVDNIEFIVDKIIDGYTKSEIAKMLDVSPQLLNKRIGKFKKELIIKGIK